mmetsp:Transcript_24600/g.36880  ORF Transcript_24600/g.36880 Transcript_24600/m.36880 type:complete len:85 (+) Transcript_24600:903-1157(+)
MHWKIVLEPSKEKAATQPSLRKSTSMLKILDQEHVGDICQKYVQKPPSRSNENKAYHHTAPWNQYKRQHSKSLTIRSIAVIRNV